MLRNILLLAIAVTLATLTASEAQAWGDYHAGYTHVGYGGVQHVGYTAARTPYGSYSSGHAGAYGYGGGSVHAGYAGGYRYGNWARPGYGWRPGGAIAAGAAIGFVSAATAAAWAGPAPGPGLCWYYTDPSRQQGFWDACQ